MTAWKSQPLLLEREREREREKQCSSMFSRENIDEHHNHTTGFQNSHFMENHWLNAVVNIVRGISAVDGSVSVLTRVVGPDEE